MKKAINLCCFGAAFFAALFSSCAGQPSAPAPWDASPAAMRQVFPDGQYIAQRGSGATRAAAEANAAAQMARFFNSQISSQVSLTERYAERNGNVQSGTEMESETFVNSQINLFGIRYALDAYFDKQQKEWVTVAYINRAEAWQVYGPRFKQQAEAFHQLFRAAEEEKDPFRKALRYIAARNYARSPDFQNADALGQILLPAKMDAEFGTVRAEAASLAQKLDSARRNAGVFIDCPVDFESMMLNVFSQKFTALGFPVANARNAAAAVCRVTVDEGMQQRELGIFYFPKLQAVISSPAGTLFAFSAEGSQSAAVTPDVARRRAYQFLVDKVNQTFSLEASL